MPHPRPGSRRTRGVRASAPPALVLLALTGCSSGPVEISSYDLAASDRSACEAFVADLPPRLADEDRVDIDPADALGAAYGDPAITVTCGVPVPDTFDQASRCDEVNGVGWFVPDGSDGNPGQEVRVSVAGYRPVVEVVVPADYRPDDPRVGDDTTAAALSVLSPLVESHLALEQPCDA